MGKFLAIKKAAAPEEYGEYAASVTRNDITWTFDANGPGPGGTYLVGTFWTGDYWVKDPGSGVGIASISPSPTSSGSSRRHGSMVNPALNETQGYDGRAAGYADGVTVSAPLTLDAGESLVSTQSRPESDANRNNLWGTAISLGNVKLISAEVLTCLAAGVPVTSFRPAISGADKTVWDTADVNTGLLPSLASQSGTKYYPTLPGATHADQLYRYFERPHLFHCLAGADVGDEVHPLNNQYHYYEAANGCLSEAALIAISDESDKMQVVNALAQWGIDRWGEINGVTLTRRLSRQAQRFPIVFAGLLLNSDTLKNNSTCNSAVNGVSWFKPDAVTYTAGSPLWHGLTAGHREQYRSNDGSLPSDYEFEHLDPVDPGWCGLGPYSDADGYRWNSYRTSTHSWCWVGICLAMVKISGLRSLYDHDPLFGQVLRWMTQDDTTLDPTWDWFNTTPTCPPNSLNGLGKHQGDCPTASGYWQKAMWNAHYSAGDW